MSTNKRNGEAAFVCMCFAGERVFEGTGKEGEIIH